MSSTFVKLLVEKLKVLSKIMFNGCLGNLLWFIVVTIYSLIFLKNQDTPTATWAQAQYYWNYKIPFSATIILISALILIFFIIKAARKLRSTIDHDKAIYEKIRSILKPDDITRLTYFQDSIDEKTFQKLLELLMMSKNIDYTFKINALEVSKLSYFKSINQLVSAFAGTKLIEKEYGSGDIRALPYGQERDRIRVKIIESSMAVEKEFHSFVKISKRALGL